MPGTSFLFMKKTFGITFLAMLAVIFIPNRLVAENESVVIKGKVSYDFSFATLALQFLETADTNILYEIADLDASRHLLNHARRFNDHIPHASTISLVKHLLLPLDELPGSLPELKRNLHFARQQLANSDLPQSVCIEYLPDDYELQANLYFTFGYDIGVVYENNASLNLAHVHFIKNYNELKYYAIHELHHAGFVALKNNQMPSLNISTYAEMADLIAYFTQLEGMGTYAPLALRKRENALDTDSDYVALQNKALMDDLEHEFFDIYFHFKNNPEQLLDDADWEKLTRLSGGNRIWYRVGARMCQQIDVAVGRAKLTGLIAGPSELFIETYLNLKQP
jgi:hypothetical protein